MPSPSYFVTVELEVMADSADDAARVAAATDNMVCGDIIDARVDDVVENEPLKD